MLILQLDGGWPNICLMRISAHHRQLGDEIVFQQAGNESALERGLFDRFDKVYASLIFERSQPLADRLREIEPNAVIGGTGTDNRIRLEQIGITTLEQDYSIYPHFKNSIGFTQRGCRLKCSFCKVPLEEGAVWEESTIRDIWRGDPFPKNIILLDNDFFGQPNWRDRIDEMRAGDFKVSFNQGINARMLTDETAAAIASVNYYDDRFSRRRIYSAWDSRPDEKRLFAGLQALVRHGVKPDEIMVYMLVGYHVGETEDDREYRRARLREFGCRPYPMAYFTKDEQQLISEKRTSPRIMDLRGYQRYVIGSHDRRVSWNDFKRAKYQPRNLGLLPTAQEELFSV